MAVTHRSLSREHVDDALHRRSESPARTARFLVLGRYGVSAVPAHARASVREAERLIRVMRLPPPPPLPPPVVNMADREPTSDGEDDDDFRRYSRWDPVSYVDELQEQLRSLQDKVSSMEDNLKDMPKLRQDVARCAALRDKYSFLEDQQQRRGMSLEQLSGKMAEAQRSLAACHEEMRGRLAAEARVVQAAEQQRSRQCAICMGSVDMQRFHTINCSQQHRVCCACAHVTAFADGFVERRYRTMFDSGGLRECPRMVLLHSCPGCWTNNELKGETLDAESAYVMNATACVGREGEL